MTNQELLMSHISKLSEDEISSLLDTVTVMLQEKEPAPKPACPHCAAQAVIRYGFVYSGEIVPMFRRNGYHCSGGTIPSVRNRIP